MRVCLVLNTDLYEPWPVLRAAREVKVLQALGREVAVVSWIKDESAPWPAREVRDGVAVRRVKFAPPKGGMARALGYRSISRMFMREVVAVRPDAILCHDLEMLWASVMAGEVLRVPVLYHAHEDWPAMVSERSPLEARAFAALERRLCARVEHVYTVGEELAQRYRAWGRPVTIQYGSKALAEMPRLSGTERSEIRAAHGFTPSDILVGIAGSLGRDEALPAVLDAIAPMEPRVKLFVVGGLTKKVAAAAALAAQKGLAERAAFTGPLPTTEYLRRVAVLDIGLALFHLTSANQRYVVPLKMFDYMGVGVPAVVSDFPSMRRIAVEGCGCAVPADSRDPASIRAAVDGLVRDPDRQRAMAAAGVRCFEATYCWERQEQALRASHPVFGGS